MSIGKSAEQYINAELGKLLRTKHPRWTGRITVEQTGILQEGAGLRPDIVIEHPGGVPVIIETELAPAATVEKDARQRLGMSLARDGSRIEQVIALRVPGNLAHAKQDHVTQLLQETEFELCVFAANESNSERWPKSGWVNVNIDDLAVTIEQVALSEDRIAKGMDILESGISQTAAIFRDASDTAPNMAAEIAEKLHQEDGEQTSRMAMAIIANAMIFHTAIAGAHDIKTLDQHRGSSGQLLKSGLLKTWQHILKNVNYWPIFSIASELLTPIKNGVARRILERLAWVASEVSDLGTTSQHDLSGRMFQRLIADRKFLATFYTLPSSATLLAELAVSRLMVDWQEVEAVKALRVADFACGTGALLNAVYAAMMSRCRRRGKDDRVLHASMMEHVLVGADIMPAATHLTASVLSSAYPSVPFADTSIITLPYGAQPEESGRPIALGALDLISEEVIQSLFGTGRERMRGVAASTGGEVDIGHGEFDLVIMNPPFTRPTGHESKKIGVPVPSFAGFGNDEEEQKAMSERLKRVRTPGMAGHGNAGLASNFIDIAHAKLRDGGTMALVLPAAFLQGDAWEGARSLLDEHYQDVCVVTIAAHGTTDRAFSADTGMAEVLVVATRKAIHGGPSPAMYVNIPGRPDSILSAAAIARAIMNIPAGQKTGPLFLASDDLSGCWVQGALSQAGCAGVRNADVAAAAAALVNGKLRLPHKSSTLEMPMAKLSSFGRRGLYHMDLTGTEKSSSGSPRGPFDLAKLAQGDVPTWPALWGHNAIREKRIVVEPDQQGIVRYGCEDAAADAWGKTASRLHFNRDFQLNSQPLAACMTPESTLGGRSWPNFVCDDIRWERPLVLWANSTLGLIAFWWIGTRQQQGRAILTISKMPFLTLFDVSKLSSGQLSRANKLFKAFANREFLPANEAYRDEVRQELDRAVLVDLLALPENTLESLDLLRRQWCAEPSVHGGKSTRP